MDEVGVSRLIRKNAAVVLWFFDNVNVSKIIDAESTKVNLHQIALDIYDLCLKFNVTVKPT